MRRRLILISSIVIVLAALAAGGYYFNEYWIIRYDGLIERQAGVYGLDPKLVWSLIYEETYFRTSVVGDAEEVGLMQVTPAVARAWARETGLREFEEKTTQNVREFLQEPERNIQIGCWYLESVKAEYRGFAAEKAMMLAAYNAGPSRVGEWTKDVKEVSKLSEQEFIERIKISTTKAYVTSILKRYREYPKTMKRLDPETQKEKPADQ
jgi:soluble lytic murein transglycosylase